MFALCQKRTLARLFDHLVGPRKQCLRQVNSNRLGGLEIYDQFEFCWFLDKKVTWPLTPKDLVHISRGATKQFDVARRIRHEPPASTYSLYGYMLGSRFIAANSTICFR